MTTSVDALADETVRAAAGGAARAQVRVSTALEAIFVAACCLVVLAGLAPEALLTDSTPLGTDLVGHSVVAWWDSSHLLGFLPGSWSGDMFNGFPVNQLYPWLPTWIAGVLSLVLPLAVAMKLVVALPLVLLPVAAWRAGRWAGLPQPMAAMLAAGTLPFLYDTSCGSCGGTVLATANGEYSFAWSLMFAVLALGAVDRLAREGRGVAVASLLVAATAFSHPLPTLWLVVGIAVVAIGREVWSDRTRARRFGVAALVAALLSAMWWVPFLAYQAWMPDNPLVRGGDTLTWLLPASQPWSAAAVALALLGTVWSVRERQWLLLAYVVGALVAVAAFLRFTDGGPFYSIRVLPFWHLGLWSLAAVGFGWVVGLVVQRLRTDRTAGSDPRVAPAAWLVVVAVVVGSTWGWWGVTQPATPTSNGRGEVLGQQVEVASAAAGVRTTLAGFAARSDYAQLTAVQDLLRGVAERYGCGTIMWDNGDLTLDSGPVFGDPQVFWQSSVWTDGCIPAADGVLVDSSMTAPAMLMTKSLVSQSVEPLLAGRRLFELDLGQGVSRMQTMGIRYYLTQGGAPAAQAKADKRLTLLAQAGPWEVWLVDKGVPAASLTSLPAVFEPTLSDTDWESVSNLYFTTDGYGAMPLAQSGPASWPTADASGLPEQVPVKAAGVSNIRIASGRITFDVENVGSPVVVRVSDFPGWTVTGADALYRATPNYLVLEPTARTVTVSKGRTVVDWAAIVAGLVGLGLLVGWTLYGRLEARSDDASDDVHGDLVEDVVDAEQPDAVAEPAS